MYILYSFPVAAVLKKIQQKRATCFATLLQNELNGEVARFANHIQTFFVTNRIVAGCETLLQKVESSSTFCLKICTCRPTANLL